MDFFAKGSMRRHPKFVHFNKTAMTICIYGACMERECNLNRRGWLALLDRLTLIWSFVVIITNGYKFATRRQGVSQEELRWVAHSDEWEWRELLTLDYLPRINSFAVLYYGLILMTVGVPLVWRIYMGFMRSRPAAGRLSRAGLADTVMSPEGRREAELQEYVKLFFAPKGTLFDSKCELVDFILDGRLLSSQENKRLVELIMRDTIERFRGEPASLGRRDDCLKRSGLLARVHENWGETRGAQLFSHTRPALFAGTTPPGPNKDTTNSRGASIRDRHAQEAHLPALGTYTVPIRSADFLLDKTERRWLFLAAHFDACCLLIFVAWVPLFSLTLIGLNRLNWQFGPPSGANQAHRAPFDTFLRVYGKFEQMYACFQVQVAFVFTNVLLKTFHADLIYKARPIRKQLNRLREDFVRGRLESAGTDAALAYQLRIWAFFDHLRQLDSFISCYSVLATIMLILGVSFGLNFGLVQDHALKLGTAAALLSDFLSYTVLHLLSEHIERQTRHLAKDIYSILAREPNSLVKLEWHRILREYYRHSYVRTFTINGRYPINMFTYLKTIAALLAACALTIRLFDRNVLSLRFALDN